MLHKPRPGAARTRAGSQGRVPGPAQGVCLVSKGCRRPRHHRRVGALEFPQVREGLSGQRSGAEVRASGTVCVEDRRSAVW